MEKEIYEDRNTRYNRILGYRYMDKTTPTPCNNRYFKMADTILFLERRSIMTDEEKKIREARIFFIILTLAMILLGIASHF
jgi:hypothetical protein